MYTEKYSNIPIDTKQTKGNFQTIYKYRPIKETHSLLKNLIIYPCSKTTYVYICPAVNFSQSAKNARLKKQLAYTRPVKNKSPRQNKAYTHVPAAKSRRRHASLRNLLERKNPGTTELNKKKKARALYTRRRAHKRNTQKKVSRSRVTNERSGEKIASVRGSLRLGYIAIYARARERFTSLDCRMEIQ